MKNGAPPRQWLEKALLLAEQIQNKSLTRTEESSFKRRLGILFTHPESKTFLIRMMDISFRPKDRESVAAFVKKILAESRQAWTALFTWAERAMVNIFLQAGYRFPSLSIPVMLSRIRNDAQHVVFLKDSAAFSDHIRQRRQQGIRSNINLIGESLLGEEEAMHRMNQYKNLLHEHNVDYISIKISTIFSQINVLAFDETTEILSERLAELYDEILEVERQTSECKFINLDMEEYRDMSVTVEVFIKTLSLPRFRNLSAGIVLQAYIPDSYLWLLKLQQWAGERVAQGGAPVKIRVVKGANMEMEKTESAIKGWSLVTFDEKMQSDANYKRMLLELLTQESCQSIRVGIASHNVFDIAYAITVVKELGLQESVEFEMLEGMANPVVDLLKQEGMKVLLYTPVVKPEQYISAIAYLVRRLDEGTAEGNFLREGFDLEPGTEKWERLKQDFIASVEMMPQLPSQPRRKQNRLTETCKVSEHGFVNEPDTDWILPANREWLAEIKAGWENNASALPDPVPVVGVSSRERELFSLHCWQGKLPWKYELATEDDYHEALQKGKSSSWFSLSHKERIGIIRRAAAELKKQRANLIGVAVTETGKLITEADPEVSEAIDFANFYAWCMEEMLQQEDTELVSGKINLVLPPWNFPVAIPAGGVLASLVTGNAVIIKPSQNAIGCSFLMCRCLWAAGVPEDALFFLPSREEVLAPFLKEADTFGAVILTGGTETARYLLRQTPDLPLFAETGGKNATIVTALSDREQAISHVVQSAFGNTGQKCSATSLLILEKEVYEDEEFKNQLKDAICSLKTGSPWDFSSRIGPLAVLPGEKVEITLQNKDNWLIPPVLKDWYFTPSVKWGVRKGDFEYENELFVPVLSVMKAENLEEAVKLANGTMFGLTAGLESLDEDEISYWQEHIQAGNLYINRPTTGAIVQRQPFGGIKQSSFGFGMKAGGVNYLTQFVTVRRSSSYFNKKLTTKGWNMHEAWLSESDRYDLAFAEKDYRDSFQELFAEPYEEVKIRGQYNLKRYRLPEQIIICADASTDLKSLLMVREACYVVGCPYTFFYLDEAPLPESLHPFAEDLNFIRHEDLAEYLDHGVRFRMLIKNIPDLLSSAAAEQGIHLYNKPVLPFGRYEFLNYLSEQSISHNYHRYGNLMGKE